ncbi:MAG: hypothetical protein HY867_01150 [Chloroflexi bacterium]|nr:hypothetical protein [Chloroflexota bacterium]
MTDFTPIHFYDDPIEVLFDEPPVREKAPHCPNGFIWRGQTYRVAASLSEWADFARRGRAAKNMRPEHAAVAAGRGSLNVGRYYFRVRALSSSSSSSSSSTAGQQNAGQTQIFDLYYDRAMKNVDDRKGQWLLYRELE